METINLHEDLIDTYREDPQMFFSEDANTVKPDYNAWWFMDYTKRIGMVLGAVWPYECKGDMKDTANRVITFAPESIKHLINAYLSLWWDNVTIVRTADNLKSELFKILIHLEGHDTLSSVEELQGFYKRGVRSFGWTWNHDTTLSGWNCSQEKWLTKLWYEVMEAMNERWMIIDTAHMSRKGMKQLLTNSKKPILNSHSNIHTLKQHSRNLPDEIIKLFPDNWWVLGLTIYGPFITSNPTATIDMYLDHLAHVVKLIGDNHVWFGTDWHGIPRDITVEWLDHISGVDMLIQKVIDRFWPEIAEKFFRKNALRVIKENLQ